MVKKIILVLFLFMLIGCQHDKLSDDDKILEVVEGENISDYSQPEIVLLYEVNSFLYNNFKLTYDEMNQIHDEYFYVGPSFNDGFNKYYMNIDASGLSVEEHREMINDKYSYVLEHIDEDNRIIGDSKYLVSITDVIPGYDDDETIVYVKYEISKTPFAYTEYRLYKYIFKEIDGQYKILMHKRSGLFSDRYNTERLSDEELEEELNAFEKIYNYDGSTVFKHEFDLRKFCEENLY